VLVDDDSVERVRMRKVMNRQKEGGGLVEKKSIRMPLVDRLILNLMLQLDFRAIVTLTQHEIK